MPAGHMRHAANAQHNGVRVCVCPQEVRELGGHWRVQAPVSDIRQGPDGVAVLTHHPDKE